MLDRRTFLASSALLASPQSAPRKPNVVIIFLDDSGWADFRPFGQPPYPTPNVERLAKQGCAFHNFYVPQAICSASRSADATIRTACRIRIGAWTGGKRRRCISCTMRSRSG